MAVRGVEHEDVDVGVNEGLGTLDRVFRDANRRAAAQPAQGVFRRVRILDRFLNVLDGDQALQPELFVDDQQFLHLVLVQDLARAIERRPYRDGDEVLARHDVGDRPVHVRLEPEIAVRQNADELAFLAAVVGDRHAGDAVLLHQLQRFVDAVSGGERDRVDDHAALGPLHAIDFRRLLLNRQVLVNHAEPAVLRHGDGEPRFGDGVHGRADERHVQPDVTREVGADVDFARNDKRVLGDEKDVVEGQGRCEVGADGKLSPRFHIH